MLSYYLAQDLLGLQSGVYMVRGHRYYLQLKFETKIGNIKSSTMKSNFLYDVVMRYDTKKKC